MAALEVSVVDVKNMIDQDDAVLIDVREPSEFHSEHIVGAHLVPLSTLDQEALPVGKRLVLQCRSGARAGQAAHKLHSAGKDVFLIVLPVLFGIVVGFSLGLTGGGSIFAVPLLVYGLAIGPREAVVLGWGSGRCMAAGCQGLG